MNPDRSRIDWNPQQKGRPSNVKGLTPVSKFHDIRSLDLTDRWTAEGYDDDDEYIDVDTSPLPGEIWYVLFDVNINRDINLTYLQQKAKLPVSEAARLLKQIDHNQKVGKLNLTHLQYDLTEYRINRRPSACQKG